MPPFSIYSSGCSQIALAVRVAIDKCNSFSRSLREIEIDLIKVQLGQMESLSKMNPFSIHPILTYLEKKKYEIFNLRAIARGKEVNLPADRIRGYLVM